MLETETHIGPIQRSRWPSWYPASRQRSSSGVVTGVIAAGRRPRVGLGVSRWLAVPVGRVTGPID